MNKIFEIETRIKRGGISSLYFDFLRSTYKFKPALYTILKFRMCVNKYKNGYTNLANPLKKIKVSPSKIKQISKVKFDKYTDIGKVVGGDWDKITVDINNSKKINAIYQRFQQGLTWEETGIYEHMLEMIDEQGYFDGCYSIDDIKKRYQSIDNLYESMSKRGYERETEEFGLDNICVNIGRNGEFIFAGGGTHRLGVAQVLGIESVPVRVVVRHQKWQEKREAGNMMGHPDVTNN